MSSPSRVSYAVETLARRPGRTYTIRVGVKSIADDADDADQTNPSNAQIRLIRNIRVIRVLLSSSIAQFTATLSSTIRPSKR